jgi:small subunit ribosomal protein S17
MAEQEDTTENTEQKNTEAGEAAGTPDTAAAEAPQSAEPAAADTPAAPAADRAAGAAPAGPPVHHGGPQEVIAPKERRRRARAAKAARVKPRGPRTPEERQQDRDATRRKNAELRRAGRARAKAKAPARTAQATPPRERTPGVQKVRQGVVVSDKAEKTIIVRIDIARRHPRYEKIVRTSSTLHAHDERNDAHTGDTVIVREARPLSRTKRWRLVQVVERAK